MRVVLTTASLDDEDDELQVGYVLPSPPTRHHTIATNLSYGTGVVMLAKVIQGISRLPLAATSPSATLLWHVLAEVFVSYREEKVMLSSTLGIKVRTPWSPSLSDPTLCVYVCVCVCHLVFVIPLPKQRRRAFRTRPYPVPCWHCRS